MKWARWQKVLSIKKHCIETSQVTNVSMESKNGGRGLRSFKVVYNKTKAGVVCYMSTATINCVKTACLV